MSKQAYEVTADLYYPSPYVADGERHAAPGAVVDDLPRTSIPWLLAAALIHPTDAAPTDARTRPLPALQEAP